MIEDTTNSRNQLEWDDEIDDETVDNLVRLIQNGKVELFCQSIQRHVCPESSSIHEDLPDKQMLFSFVIGICSKRWKNIDY